MSTVLFCSAMAKAQNDETTRITVLVQDSARLSRSMLRQAEMNAAQLFQIAGIEIDWINCAGPGHTDRCRHVLGDREFVLHIVPAGKTQNGLVFGEAFLGEDGRGKYCDVFFDRVKGTSGTPELDVPQLLGAVAAHELGHLLLGTQAHSRVGLMEPTWERESLRQIGMNRLLFTREQSAQMKWRLGVERLSLSALRTANRGMIDNGY